MIGRREFITLLGGAAARRPRGRLRRGRSKRCGGRISQFHIA
jgi:hypothetical protein